MATAIILMQGDIPRAVFVADDSNGNDPRQQASSFLAQFGANSPDDPPAIAKAQAGWLAEVPINAIA